MLFCITNTFENSWWFNLDIFPFFKRRWKVIADFKLDKNLLERQNVEKHTNYCRCHSLSNTVIIQCLIKLSVQLNKSPIESDYFARKMQNCILWIRELIWKSRDIKFRIDKTEKTDIKSIDSINLWLNVIILQEKCTLAGPQIENRSADYYL